MVTLTDEELYAEGIDPEVEFDLSEAKSASDELAAYGYCVPVPGYTKPGKPKKLLESIFANPDAGNAFDDRFYQALETGGIMDLPSAVQQKIQRLSLLSFRKNPLAYGSIQVTNEFVVGGGVRPIASDSRVQEVLDQHWRENEWDEKLPERARALSIFGEQVYPAFIRDEDGLVTVSSISPLKLQEVMRSPDDDEEIVAITTAKGGNEGAALSDNVSTQTAITDTWDVIRRLPTEEGLGPHRVSTQGIVPLGGNPDAPTPPKQAFFFAINRVSGAARGTPDICSAMDWIEGLDGILFSLLERAELTQDVVFDLTYDGANDQAIKKHVRGFVNALRSGGVYAHNEKVKLQIMTPQLAASDASKMVGLIRDHINSGTRLSGLFYGSGADLTRASAAELSIPVAKHFETRQGFIEKMLRKILNYQIQEAKRRGRLAGVTDFRFQIRFPRIFLRDLSTIASSLQLASIALQLGQQNEWITSAEASNLFRGILEAFGTDVSDMIIVPDRAQDQKPAIPAGQIYRPGDDVDGLPSGPKPAMSKPGPKLESIQDNVFIIDGKPMVVDQSAAGGFSPAPNTDRRK